MVSCLSLWMVVVSVAGPAQEDPAPLQLPDCDLFLFDLVRKASGLELTECRNITARSGYDNQPWFTPEGKSILFSSGRQPGRTDVYEYTLSTGAITQVTDTPTQEYSPQIDPKNETVSFVTDGATANQSIWFTKRGSGEEEWLLANQGEREPVGYYSWNHETDYILYWSRYGFSIRLVHRTKPISHYVTGNAPPTTPYIVPGTQKFSFVHQQGNGQVWIKELDPETLAVRPLTPIQGSNRNYGWTPSQEIVMIQGDQLLICKPSAGKTWTPIADLTKHGIVGSNRVAVSPKGTHIAIVGRSAK